MQSTRIRAAIVLVALAAALVGCTPDPTVPPTTTTSTTVAPPPCDAGLVGDSLLVYATAHVGLEDTFAAAGCPARVNALEGRSTTQAAAVVEQWAADGTLPSVIGVTSAGWDAFISAFDAVGPSVDRVMAAAAGRPVVWVNAFVLNGTTNDQTVNAILAAKDAEYPNLTVLDHYSWVDAHRDLLVDFAHLNTDGERQWTQRLLDAVRQAALVGA